MRELRLYSDIITVSVGWSVPLSVVNAQGQRRAKLRHCRNTFVSAGLAHGEVHYPCGLGTMNSDSVRAEVHYPEGFDRGLTLCDQKCQFGFYTKRVSATVGYLPG